MLQQEIRNMKFDFLLNKSLYFLFRRILYLSSLFLIYIYIFFFFSFCSFIVVYTVPFFMFHSLWNFCIHKLYSLFWDVIHSSVSIFHFPFCRVYNNQALYETIECTLQFTAQIVHIVSSFSTFIQIIFYSWDKMNEWREKKEIVFLCLSFFE